VGLRDVTVRNLPNTIDMRSKSKTRHHWEWWVIFQREMNVVVHDVERRKSQVLPKSPETNIMITLADDRSPRLSRQMGVFPSITESPPRPTNSKAIIMPPHIRLVTWGSLIQEHQVNGYFCISGPTRVSLILGYVFEPSPSCGYLRGIFGYMRLT
jgi:hypothetical protein